LPRKITRRDVGWTIARSFAVAGAQPFLSEWLESAQTAAHTYEHKGGISAPPAPDRWSGYKPTFFSPAQFKMLDQFTAILIPSDDTPGAREAHVAAFIDFVVNAAAEYAPEMQKEWRTAMDWLATSNFADMQPEAQFHFIEQISAPERGREKTHAGFAAYQMIKDMTVRAFYTSRVGLIDVLEYKGNTYLTEFPGCTHPEHRKV
jgi:hypothetical protein